VWALANVHCEWSALPLNSSPDNTHTAPIDRPKRMAPDMMPLGDIRILSLEQFGAGPWGTMQLADLGADVIRIEDPTTRGEVGRSVPPYEQDGSSLFFESFNRNKRSLALDLRYPESRSVLEDLVRGSDAVFSNLRGDQPGKLRLRYDDLKHVNPRIVCVSLSGFGMTGPRASEGAYDATVQGLAGWMSVTGGPDDPPMKSGLSLVDFSAGYVATIAVLTGVWRARREGVGCDADLSLFETALGLLNYMATWSASRGWHARRMPASAHQTLVPFQAFQAADGWLVVACPKETLWRRLCEALEQPSLADDERFAGLAARDEHRDVLLPILEAAFSRRSVGEWIERLTAHGVPCAPVNDIALALGDAQATAREAVVGYEHPVLGDVRTVASPLRLSDSQRPVERAPFLGEHTAEILADVCGYSAERIEQLAAVGIFGDLGAEAGG
jgi:crotonobetainyl-CoA:carnitine CoA-transferase CaiB-like acyl-CoA transferase